ncbi:N-terminal glutamine amidase-domain-containing protein [Myxozyma melibiosi]|uniref:Protein N-terminal glutamine amidohydrolase n=1 Tax=Myxozyma melibiosi TaxID=54550 RepID=A0ABR1F414_9ASCO
MNGENTLDHPADLFEGPYQAFYCEENIYQAARLLKSQENSEAYVLFISNHSQTVQLFCQRQREPFVIWDYHVILIRRALKSQLSDDYEVLDYDSSLSQSYESKPGFCTARIIPFSQYASETFRFDLDIPEFRRFKPLFRCIEAHTFLRCFSSDRSHMLVEESSTEYVEPVPGWPVIRGRDALVDNGLPSFIDMHQNSSLEYGAVLDGTELCSKFGYKEVVM